MSDCIQAQIVQGIVTVLTAIIVAFTIRWDRNRKD